MSRIFCVLLLVAACCHLAVAQTPKIDNVQRIVTYPFSEVVITGSGFSSTSSDLQVWFGNVKGTISSSTESTINVVVPAQARLNAVEVINLASKRSGKSAKKFMPNFSGKQPFTNSFTTTSFSNADDIFDLCTCDFNGDGKTDIAGSKFKDGKSNIMLLTNTSTVGANSSSIAFTQSALTLSFPTFSVACGDLNGDGKPELIASRGGQVTGNTIYIFPNTSAGSISFGAFIQLDLPLGDFAKEVAVHDLNGDGKPEIIVTNGQTNLLYIFENKLSGSSIVAGEFTRLDKTVTGATNTLALEIADFNGDGWPDIATTPNTNAQKVLIMPNPGNGTLNFVSVTSISIAGSLNINDLAVADFNNDGNLDLVMSDRGVNKAFVYLNRGSLIFQSVNSSTGFASPTSWGIDVADMNGDGFADFVTGNRDFADGQVNVYINSGASTPSFTGTKLPVSKATWFVKAGDYDGDSKPDIAVTATNNSNSFSIDVLKNGNCHQPVILNDNPLTICTGQTVTLKAVPLQGVAFSWSGGGTGPTKDITVANAGTITLTAVGEGGTCSVQTSITVVAGAGTAPAKPTISGPDGVCEGSPLSFTTGSVAGSPTYLWEGPNGFSSSTSTPSVSVTANATPSQAGDYLLRVKVGDCISVPSDPKTISVVAPASFTISSNSGGNQACSGNSLTLSVNQVSGYTYQWKKGGSNIAGQTASSYTIPAVAVSDAGSYTVFISHATISCSSETSPFTVSVVSKPVASFTKTPNQVCVGTEVTFTSTSTVDNAATPTFSWNFGDAGTGAASTEKHTYLTANASVTVELTVGYTGLTGCSHTASQNFSVSNATAPVIETNPAGILEICADQTETVELQVVGTFSSITWTPSGTGTPLSVKQPGTYAVQTTDANGCTGNAEITLTPKDGCSGGPVVINVEIPKVFTPDGLGQPETERWIISNIAQYPECTMSVFDGRGMRVYEVTGFPESGWDGRSSGGSALPKGTYFYAFGCPNAKPLTGSVLIIR